MRVQRRFVYFIMKIVLTRRVVNVGMNHNNVSKSIVEVQW